jgi:hypothetical protein
VFSLGSKHRFVLFVSCLLVGILHVVAGAQSLPGFGWLDITQINVSPVKVGLFYGAGNIKADHYLEAGPTSTTLWSGGTPDFNSFVHHREVELKDAYVLLESGVQRFGAEILNARVETNFGRLSKFRQETDAAAGKSNGRESNLLIALESNQNGEIIRDTTNRIWDIEVSARLPLISFADILLGYKYNYVKSDIKPYDAGYAVPFPPPHPSVFFPGLPGWIPYVLDADNPPLPNSEQLKMSEMFKWQGLFVGVRFNNLLGLPERNRGYLEVIWSPCIFGRYEFAWNTGFVGVFGAGQASQVTKVSQKLNSFVAIRSGATFPLVGNLSCDVFLKYHYVKMNLSDLEFQSVDLEWPAFSAFNAVYSQTANQSMNVRQNFFGAGASLVLSF